MVSVLFTQTKSIYNQLDVDCWDIERDARKWPGGNPIVAHPPCRAWGRLAQFAKPRPDEKELAIYAVEMVRKHGGVLEHPYGSTLWSEIPLPQPGNRDTWGGVFNLRKPKLVGTQSAKENATLYSGMQSARTATYPYILRCN